MPRLPLLTTCILAPLLLGGCVSTVASVVTAPVRLASGAVSGAADLATTSQSEADERRGREARERDQQIGRLQRRYANLAQDCGDGDRDACLRARDVRREMDDLIAGMPEGYQPED